MRTKRKKHSLTLLEVAIAICLIGILVPSLWSVYQNWFGSYKNIQETHAKIEKKLFLKHRLERLCLRLKDLNEPNFLFTPQEKSIFPSICFSYKAEPDKDPAFNGVVRSLLYVDERKQLCLTTWGTDLKKRTEVLLKEISSLRITFFDPEKASWEDSWLETLDHLPLWIKLEIETGKEKLDLKIRSSLHKGPILYLKMANNGVLSA